MPVWNWTTGFWPTWRRVFPRQWVWSERRCRWGSSRDSRLALGGAGRYGTDWVLGTAPLADTHDHAAVIRQDQIPDPAGRCASIRLFGAQRRNLRRIHVERVGTDVLLVGPHDGSMFHSRPPKVTDILELANTPKLIRCAQSKIPTSPFENVISNL